MKVAKFKCGLMSVYIFSLARGGSGSDRWLARWALCHRDENATHVLARGNDDLCFENADEAATHARSRADVAIAELNDFVARRAPEMIKRELHPSKRREIGKVFFRAPVGTRHGRCGKVVARVGALPCRYKH